MNKFLLLIVLSIALSLWASTDARSINGLTISVNGIRGGDILTRNRIPFCKSMTSDTIEVWDFSNVQVSNDEMETRYFNLGCDVVENEDRESRIYGLDSINFKLKRHYRAGMDVLYNMPETIEFPISCGSKHFNNFFGEGQLGSLSYIKDAGLLEISADMIGNLITPDCDTIKNVLRLHTNHSGTSNIYNDYRKSYRVSKDSLLFSSDSIRYWLAHDSITHTIDKWQWFAKGYRYPIIEMRKYKTLKYDSPQDSILVSLYYPISRQIDDVKNDTLNEKIRMNSNLGYSMHNSKAKRTGNNNVNNTNIISGKISHDAITTIVSESNVTATIHSGREEKANCYLTSVSGILFWHTKTILRKGTNEIVFPIDFLNSGVYILVIDSDSNLLCTKIIK